MLDKMTETEALETAEWLHAGNQPVVNTQNSADKLAWPVQEMVTRNGENLYTARIATFLLNHPKVAEVQVVGVPDPVMGEELLALLKLKPGARASIGEIRAYCREVISKHQIPRYLRVVAGSDRKQGNRKLWH